MTLVQRIVCLPPLVAIICLTACARRAAEPVVAVAEPAPTAADTIPPPRLIPPAAEPCDATDATEVFAIVREDGTWKFQHQTGVRELDDVHLPVGRPVKLTLTTESAGKWFGVPAFPLSLHALPGKYTDSTVRATRAGEFGIWTDGRRVGTVFVIPLNDYTAWVEGKVPLPGTQLPDVTPAGEGRMLFMKLQCVKCHGDGGDATGPSLAGVYGSKVPLEGGGVVVADDEYIRESILKPRAKLVANYKPIMPSYQGQVTDEDIVKLAAYIRSLKSGGKEQPPGERFPAPVGAPTEPPKGKGRRAVTSSSRRSRPCRRTGAAPRG